MTAARERVIDLFPRLFERRKQVAGYLSGGEQQMLAIGRALMTTPKLLVLDEPSLGLAPKLVEQIRDIIVDINQQGTSVLLIEQNAIDGALDRQLRLHHGDRQDRHGRRRRRSSSPTRTCKEFYLGLHGDDGETLVVPRREALQTTQAVGVVTALLEVEDITLRFGGVTAISRVSFDVQPGELFAIIGPNGAGKTSIFNTISQVYKPQQGDIRFQGTSLMGLRPDKVAEFGIARTFQNIELFAQMNVVDNLLTGRHMRMKRSWLAGAVWWGAARREEIANRAKVEEIIDFLEIEQWRRHPVSLLPYGYQKRVELGRALAMEPMLLLLDEPVAGMNLEETADMARFILDIQRELGITMVMVEHDMGLVMDIADRVMVLDFGEQIALGTPAEVQRNPNVIAAYLGSDFA